MKEKILRTVYLLTKPFAYLSAMLECISDILEDWDVWIYRFMYIGIAVWILAVSKNIEEGAATVAFMLIMGFLPLSATILEVVVYIVVHVLWIPCLILSWIHDLCVKHMSTGRNGAYSYSNTRSDGESRGRGSRTYGSWDSWERHDRYDDSGSNDRSGESRGNSSTEDDLQRARRIFNLVGSVYTVEELRKRRRVLMKQIHPDEGGSKHTAQEVNAAYDLLKNYAAA